MATFDFLEGETQTGKKAFISKYKDIAKQRYLRKYTENEKDILMKMFNSAIDGLPLQMIDTTLVKCTFETITDNYDRLCKQNELAEKQFEEGFLTFKELNTINRRLNNDLWNLFYFFNLGSSDTFFN